MQRLNMESSITFSLLFLANSYAQPITPTSVLDSTNSNFSNPFGCETRTRSNSKPRTPCPTIPNSETEAIGLALIDSIIDEKFHCRFSKPINRTALFGSKLKVHILEVNDSPAESTQEFGRQLSLKEMEKSEDYTCVIMHGPNSKTTHIYHDCIVESSC